jgi:MFS family permease
MAPVVGGAELDGHQPPRQHYRVTFAVLAIGTLAYTLMQSMVLPALDSIQHDLHTTQSDVAWLLSAFLLSSSVATPVLGRLGDMFGKEKLLVVTFAVLSVGTVVGGLAHTLWLLILARTIQGVAGAVFPLSFAIIRDEFPEEKVPGGIGLISTLLGIGSGVGIIIGGPVVQHLSYHWLFWIPLGLSLLALVATVRFVPESPVKTPGRIDVRGGLLLSAWLVALLVAVTEGPDWGWSSPGVIGLFVGAAVLLVLWIWLETRTRQPLVDMRLMRLPTVWWTNIAAFLFGSGMYAIVIVLPPFVEIPRHLGYGFGASPTVAGLYLVPSATSMLVAGLGSGRITAAVGAKATLVLGAALAAVPFGLLALFHSHPWEIFAAGGVSGFGIGLGFSAMTNLVVDAVPATDTGVATGMSANIRTIGGAIGSQLVASILSAGVLATGYSSERSFVIALSILAVSFLAASLAALVVPGTRGAPGTAATGRSDPSLVQAGAR